MNQVNRFDPARLWAEYGTRLMRYGGVTVVTTVVGLTTLFVGLSVIDLPRASANLLSVVVSTPFAYYLNRRYVWERKPGNHSASREVGPFWIMNLLGLVFSTLVVWLAGFLNDSTPFLLLSQLSAFGALWLVKFAFLEKYLRNDDRENVAERV